MKLSEAMKQAEKNKITKKYEFEAITDEVATCELCGKNGLERVIALKDENGEITFAGTTCGARALRINSPVKNLDQLAQKATAKKELKEKYNKVLAQAQKQANKTGEVIAVISSNRGIYTAREKAVNAAPYLHNGSFRWITPE